jgi:hypothetical protein
MTEGQNIGAMRVKTFGKAMGINTMIDDRTRMKQWPIGCQHPKSCARHRACLFAGCPFVGKDIAKPTSIPMQPSDPRIRAEDRRKGLKQKRK